jgi:hypothetical protein
MRFAPRLQADIIAARTAAILAGAKIIPKGECHMCAWPFQGKELYCSQACETDYEAERVELTAASRKGQFLP